MRLTDEQIREIKERAKVATPGPWYGEDSDACWQLFAESQDTHQTLGMEMKGHPLQLIKAPKRSTPFAEYWPNQADADFIANARTDIPRMLADIVAQEEENKRLWEFIHEVANETTGWGIIKSKAKRLLDGQQ